MSKDANITRRVVGHRPCARLRARAPRLVARPVCARGGVLAAIRAEIERATSGIRVETAILDVDDSAAVQEAIPELAARFGRSIC